MLLELAKQKYSVGRMDLLRKRENKKQSQEKSAPQMTWPAFYQEVQESRIPLITSSSPLLPVLTGTQATRATADRELTYSWEKQLPPTEQFPRIFKDVSGKKIEFLFWICLESHNKNRWPVMFGKYLLFYSFYLHGKGLNVSAFLLLSQSHTCSSVTTVYWSQQPEFLITHTHTTKKVLFFSGYFSLWNSHVLYVLKVFAL